MCTTHTPRSSSSRHTGLQFCEASFIGKQSGVWSPLSKNQCLGFSHTCCLEGLSAQSSLHHFLNFRGRLYSVIRFTNVIKLWLLKLYRVVVLFNVPHFPLQFRQEYLDTLYRYAKFQYECGNYSGAAEYLYFFRVLVSL